jgi:hypothetical protein
MSNKNLRRGGFIAPYSGSPNASEYMLNSSVNVDAINNINYSNNKASGPEIYVPPSSTAAPATTTPGIRGGSNKQTDASDKMELDDVFYYSMDGGCACNSGTSGGGKKMKKGGDIVLTPFISALALLGARMLADKNSGFNLSELMYNKSSEENEIRGGKPKKTRRAGASCARMSGC